jgi:hypothetical protein
MLSWKSGLGSVVLLVALLLDPITEVLHSWQPDLARLTAEFHIAFNMAMAIVFIGLLASLATLLKRLTGPGGRSVTTAISRRERAQDALVGAGRRRARNFHMARYPFLATSDPCEPLWARGSRSSHTRPHKRLGSRLFEAAIELESGGRTAPPDIEPTEQI